jgi:hypothetical protein
VQGWQHGARLHAVKESLAEKQHRVAAGKYTKLSNTVPEQHGVTGGADVNNTVARCFEMKKNVRGGICGKKETGESFRAEKDIVPIYRFWRRKAGIFIHYLKKSVSGKRTDELLIFCWFQNMMRTVFIFSSFVHPSILVSLQKL